MEQAPEYEAGVCIGTGARFDWNMHWDYAYTKKSFLSNPIFTSNSYAAPLLYVHSQCMNRFREENNKRTGT